jgi:hypothetical protein
MLRGVQGLSPRTLIRRVALGLTLPVGTYMVLSVLTTSEHAGIVALAGGSWCAAIWACYRLVAWRQRIGTRLDERQGERTSFG